MSTIAAGNLSPRSRGQKRPGEGRPRGRGRPPPLQTTGLGERRELPSGVRGRAPVKSSFHADYASQNACG